MIEEPTKTPGDILAKSFAQLRQQIDALTPEIRAERKRHADEIAQRQRQTAITQLLNESKAPERQRQNRNLDRSGPWAVTEQKILSKLGSGFFIGLIGTRGGGKTQLGVEAIRRCSRDLKRSRFCTATEFFIEIKSSYNSEENSEKNVLDRFTKPQLLVIDEVGQRSESEWENRLLFELLNRRYNAIKDTLLISNQTVESFCQSLGPSLVSRMQETGGLIECKWPSYRK
ncbi:MAG TPA: ATP-binding protein [Verrucomicrobiae bacterium]|nr:ATP-binding protein [Verrucomicrobiae bacterium]